MKKNIEVFAYAKEILQALPQGVLLTTKAGEKINSMTIGWGMLGTEWGKPIFLTLVREHRFTKEQLDQNPEFTINIPWGEREKKILAVCGSHSGRDMDKIKQLGMTLVEPEKISVPAIQEFPLTLECKVIYQQKQEAKAIPADYRALYYPQEVGSDHCGANRDYHIAYYGEIVSAYLL